MPAEMLRFFIGTNAGFLYRIYVTSSDLLCVRMGRSRIPVGIGAGAAAAQAYEEAKRNFDREVEEEGHSLAKRGEEGVRVFIRANKRGYCFDPDDLTEIRLDYAGKWKRWFFMSPSPALFLQTKSENLKFLLPQKKDVVIALHELQLLLGEDLEVGLRLDDYKKAMKKYEKMRNS
jgi:hypothetical protein